MFTVFEWLNEVVQAAVLPCIKKARPRALFVGYAETDDWRHEGRYDDGS